MKKKILSLGVILMLVIMLIALTGCGKQETTQELSNSNKNNTEVSNEISDNANKTEIEIKDVKAVSENYAVVTGYDNSTYIIDKKGNYQGTIPLSHERVLINKDGYIAVKEKMNKVNIYDKTGKELFKSDDTTEFQFVVTDSNLLLRKTTESSFSGNTSKNEIIDVNGNVKFETEIGDVEYIGYDLVAKIYSNGMYLSYEEVYDLKTNTKVDISKLYSLKENGEKETNANLDLGVNDSDYEEWSYDNVKQNDNVLEINYNYCMNDKNEIIYKESNDKVLSNQYYYDSDTKAICKYDGTVVKDLSEGDGASRNRILQ